MGLDGCGGGWMEISKWGECVGTPGICRRFEKHYLRWDWIDVDVVGWKSRSGVGVWGPLGFAPGFNMDSFY